MAHMANGIKVPSENAASDAFAKAAEVIPSFYYDIIARIVPGAATIIGVAWALNIHVVPEEGGGGWVLLAGAGYIVGLLLSVISTILVNIVTLLPGWRHRYSDGAIWQGIWQRRNDPDAPVVIKMAAESTSAENLLVGGLLVLIAAFVFTGSKDTFMQAATSATNEHSQLVLIVLCALLAAMVTLRRYFLRARIQAAYRRPGWCELVADVQETLWHAWVIMAIRWVMKLRGKTLSASEVTQALGEILNQRARDFDDETCIL
jgi:hypothetical protein